MEGTDVQRICTVTSDFGSVTLEQFPQKHKSFWSKMRGKNRYYIVRYIVKAVVGPADLRFELCKFAMARMHGSLDPQLIKNTCRA